MLMADSGPPVVFMDRDMIYRKVRGYRKGIIKGDHMAYNKEQGTARTRGWRLRQWARVLVGLYFGGCLAWCLIKFFIRPGSIYETYTLASVASLVFTACLVSFLLALTRLRPGPKVLLQAVLPLGLGLGAAVLVGDLLPRAAMQPQAAFMEKEYGPAVQALEAIRRECPEVFARFAREKGSGKELLKELEEKGLTGDYLKDEPVDGACNALAALKTLHNKGARLLQGRVSAYADGSYSICVPFSSPWGTCRVNLYDSAEGRWRVVKGGSGSTAICPDLGREPLTP